MSLSKNDLKNLYDLLEYFSTWSRICDDYSIPDTIENREMLLIQMLHNTQGKYSEDDWNYTLGIGYTKSQFDDYPDSSKQLDTQWYSVLHYLQAQIKKELEDYETIEKLKELIVLDEKIKKAAS